MFFVLFFKFIIIFYLNLFVHLRSSLTMEYEEEYEDVTVNQMLAPKSQDSDTTEILNNLLKEYDKKLRPDIGGKAATSSPSLWGKLTATLRPSARPGDVTLDAGRDVWWLSQCVSHAFSCMQHCAPAYRCSRGKEVFTVGHMSQVPHLTGEWLCHLHVCVCAFVSGATSCTTCKCHFTKDGLMSWPKIHQLFPVDKNHLLSGLHWPALCLQFK